MPFSRKLMPAAFPAFTTISRLARTEVCAGAIRVSWATGLPSARIETQVVFPARIRRVKVAGGLAAGAVAFAVGGVAEALGARGKVVDARVVVGGVGLEELVTAEMVPAGKVPADKALAGEGGPGVSELEEPEGGVAADTGAEAAERTEVGD